MSASCRGLFCGHGTGRGPGPSRDLGPDAADRCPLVPTWADRHPRGMKVTRSVDPSGPPDSWHDLGPGTAPGSRPARRTAALPGALVLATAGVALLVGRDGSAGWRGTRVVAVVAVTVGAWWVLRRAGTIWRGLVAVIAGLLATAVGVGIALPHVTKDGLTAVSVAGLACLAAGLVLVVGGTGTLLCAPPDRGGASRSWLRSSWRPTRSCSSSGSRSPRRTCPGRPSASTPLAHGLAYEDVTFSTADGVALSGWYVPSRNGAAVVLLHGAGSTRSAVLAQRSCWPTTASACCSTTPVATDAARGEPWTSAGTATWT